MSLKQLLDTAELRSAFSLSEALPERIKRFRDDRISQIMARQTPIPLIDAPTLVLHLLPVSSFSRYSEIPIGKLPSLQPIGSGGYDLRRNIDGVATYEGPRNGTTGSRTYCQIYRSGRVESVYADIARAYEEHSYIASVAYEKYIIEAVGRYLNALKDLEIQLPIVVSLCILNAEGAEMFVDRFNRPDGGAPIDRPILVLPDVLLEDYEAKIPVLMRPIFDAVWNACGYEGSSNYDKDGNWKPKQ